MLGKVSEVCGVWDINGGLPITHLLPCTQSTQNPPSPASENLVPLCLGEGNAVISKSLVAGGGTVHMVYHICSPKSSWRKHCMHQAPFEEGFLGDGGLPGLKSSGFCSGMCSSIGDRGVCGKAMHLPCPPE